MSHASFAHDDLGHHGDDGHGDHAGHGDHGIAKYIYVFVALCILTTMSFLTYSDLWPTALGSHEVKRLFMMAVSCTKAMLVILFFMHVKYEANWKYVLTIPASMMSIFLMLALVPDIGARVNGLFGYHGKYSPERMQHVGQRQDVKDLHDTAEELAKHGHGAAAAGSHAAPANEMPAAEEGAGDAEQGDGAAQEAAEPTAEDK